MTTLHGGTAPLAALTTVFTPPCQTSWLVTTTKLPSQYPSFPAAGPVATCDPPAWASNLAGEGFQYYSPAICPDGFEVGQGCTLATTPRTAEGFPAVAADETVAWCVPSGQTCTSDTTDFRGGIWGVSRTATAAGADITVGPAMQIRWRDVDLSILATHPLTPGLTLAGGPALVTPPTPPTRTPPQPRPTPGVDASSSPNGGSTDTTATTSSPTGGAAVGFITVKGKSTQSSGLLAPVTSTVEVVTGGTTFVSTVVTSPTAGTEPAPNGAGANGTTSNSVNSMPTTRAFTATIVMACLLSVTAVAIIAYFLLSRRRSHRQQQKQQQQQAQLEYEGNDGGAIGNTAQATATTAQRAALDPGTAISDGSSSLGLSSVGVGAWVKRRRPRWRIAWRRTKAWWSSFRFWRVRSPLTGDKMHSLWQRRHRQHRNQQQQNMSALGRARTPLAELPTTERVLADFVELEGSPVVERREDADDDDADSYMSLQKLKGIPPMRPGWTSASRWGGGLGGNNSRLSWMSRLSRYMRGGRNSSNNNSTTDGGGGGGGGRDTPGSMDYTASSSVSRASTRWSRWTRTDTASVMTSNIGGGGEGGDDSDHSYYRHMNTIPTTTPKGHESSWEAFSRSREGVDRLQLVKQKGGGGGGNVPRRGNTRGLSAPSNNPIPRYPSPAITVRSDRTGTPELLGREHRFSRLSDGTFGRMGSYISRDGSRTGDMPGRSGSGGGSHGGESIDV